MKLSRTLVLTTLLLSAFAAPVAAARDVPIKGTTLGEHGLDLSAPGCDEGAIWRFNSSGTGKMSHLGTISSDLSHCTFVDPETGLFLARDGEIVFTAKNGDTLVVAEDGVFEAIADASGFLGFTGTGTWTAVGGTGRFASATGTGTWQVVGDVPGGPQLFGLPDGFMTTDFTGRIAYNASDRSSG